MAKGSTNSKSGMSVPQCKASRARNSVPHAQSLFCEDVVGEEGRFGEEAFAIPVGRQVVLHAHAC